MSAPERGEGRQGECHGSEVVSPSLASLSTAPIHKCLGLLGAESKRQL